MTQQLQAELDRFNKEAKWKTHTIGDHTWRYVTSGKGDEWLLLIHGGGGNASTIFRYVTNLSPHFRIIAPSIPGTLTSMQEITDGLIALFDREGTDQAHVYGPSLGGMIAQVLAATYPERVGKCIFSHAGLPEPDQGQTMSKALLPLRLIPYPLFRWQMLRSIRSGLQTDIPDIDPEESTFWLSQFETVFKNELGKADVIGSVHLQIDYHGRLEQLAAAPLRHEPERFMLLFHENDQGFGAETQTAMREFYPTARFRLLPLYGHLGALARADGVIDEIKAFLQEKQQI
ncbi:MAG: alpha/beta hydrolase [Chloroflexota bacterium]